MEKQEAINLMKLWRASVEMNGADSEHLDAFDMAIEALSEPSRQGQRDGLISRQDVYDLIDNWGEPMILKSAFRCDIEDLSDAQLYTESEIQTMQDLEQAQLDKMYEMGWKEGREALKKYGKMGEMEWISKEDAINTSLEFFVEFLGGALHENAQKELITRFQRLSSAQPERETEFEKLTVRDSNGRPYYSIIYLEFDDNGIGHDFEGYSSYSLDVISGYLKKYFMPSAHPERQKGEWVGVVEYCKHLEEETGERYQPSGMGDTIYCNKCWCGADKKSDFCPNCGSDNRLC